MRDGKDCVCVRDASYRKCKRCQRIGKPCERVPLQLRRRAAVWAAIPPAIVNGHEEHEIQRIVRQAAD